MRWAIIIAAPLAFAHLALADYYEPTEHQQTLHELNQGYRISRGLERQQLDAELCRLAQSHAEQMAARQSMYHGPHDQIVAYGASTCTGAMGLWRGSGPHNGFLLSRTTRAGWGHAVSAGGTHYWAGAFRGEPQPADSSPQVQYSRRGGFLSRLFGR